jgi:hypothetical protein
VLRTTVVWGRSLLVEGDKYHEKIAGERDRRLKKSEKVGATGDKDDGIFSFFLFLFFTENHKYFDSIFLAINKGSTRYTANSYTLHFSNHETEKSEE